MKKKFAVCLGLQLQDIPLDKGAGTILLTYHRKGFCDTIEDAEDKARKYLAGNPKESVVILPIYTSDKK